VDGEKTAMGQEEREWDQGGCRGGCPLDPADEISGEGFWQSWKTFPTAQESASGELLDAPFLSPRQATLRSSSCGRMASMSDDGWFKTLQGIPFNV